MCEPEPAAAVPENDEKAPISPDSEEPQPVQEEAV